MNFLENYPDIIQFFDNFHVRGNLLNDELEEKLKEIYKKNIKYDFFAKNIISIDMIIKELIQNCIKAHIKRWIINRYKLNPLDDLDYQKLLRILKHILYFLRVEELVNLSEDFNYHFDVYLSFHPKLLLIHILNEGKLFPEEEKRIRLKFLESILEDNLYNYYLKHSDSQEGAGMGIAIINIILKQIGLASRNFVIFNFKDPHQEIHKTVSRIYIPLDKSYQLPRYKFEIYLKHHYITPEELRNRIRQKEIYIPFL